MVTPDEQQDYAHFTTYRNQQATGILRKVRHITLHRPISNRSESNPRRFSGQSASQGRLTRLQPHRASPWLSGQPAAQEGIIRLQPRRISMHLRTTGCPGWTHSPAASPDLHASPDNRLPRTDSPAFSLARSLHNSGQPAAQDGLTRLQLHRNTGIFTDRLPRHPDASSRSHGPRTTPAAQHRNAPAHRS